MTTRSHPTPRQNPPRLLVEQVGKELVIYNQASRRIHRLNSTAAAIWRLGNARLSAAQLAARLRAQPGLRRISVRVVEQALARLQATGLLRKDTPVRGASRHRTSARSRAIVIASIEAPTPLMAASTDRCGVPCSSNTDCAGATDGCVYCSNSIGSTKTVVNRKGQPVAIPFMCVSAPA